MAGDGQVESDVEGVAGIGQGKVYLGGRGEGDLGVFITDNGGFGVIVGGQFDGDDGQRDGDESDTQGKGGNFFQDGKTAPDDSGTGDEKI